ncbi:hypothetical protein ACHJH3_05980 [Campylobacter sp. MOP7]|uniref:hypothetical protein n=1 Tax=Campylobacter canis TaxID=3378588 RepID=UPI00387E8E76
MSLFTAHEAVAKVILPKTAAKPINTTCAVKNRSDGCLEAFDSITIFADNQISNNMQSTKPAMFCCFSDTSKPKTTVCLAKKVLSKFLPVARRVVTATIALKMVAIMSAVKLLANVCIVSAKKSTYILSPFFLV